ncbi:beta-ketoacyl synthase N-terminal-like domain-containing protein [Flammeovirga aprica]|uniref:PfaB family protein n=1 Tax=Flammeovirga aprica JL-4 TaxID=694437 RepID=A0A7X9S0D6_9BACT|nr:beta-ketoacyl synthase N-terminal-like domain-containing protein [Flammeovirga aprica]NME72105.1 PfaB family protein [Flammeovirga aprica JL-4]
MSKKDKIAVIGMGGLFPGSATLDTFWNNLLENKDLVTLSDEKTFGQDPLRLYHTEKGKLDKCYAIRGGYVRDFDFDPSDYKIQKNLLAKQDDQFKWSLYVAQQALKDSGYWQNTQDKNCGVIVGNLSFPTRRSRQIFSPIYADMAGKVFTELTGEEVKVPFANTNYDANIHETLLTNSPSALIAQAVGLTSTNYSLDAACASSLYAIKLAIDELQLGKADMMLAGAVSGADPLFIHMGFSYFHAYARMNEKSAPLDNTSGGLTSSEGAGMVVLKRLSDAQKDGDKILAVIDGVGLSNDGKGKFLLSPNPKGQKLSFERAYKGTNLTPAEIDYLECHATGTPLGDTTEINSISDFFAQEEVRPPFLGSVKSNMGHLLTAAGMTGMLKVILAMQKKFIPATIKIDGAVHSNDQKVGRDQMMLENKEWPQKGELPHAGINAFGFGGTNAHMILSAYDEKVEVEKEQITSPKQPLSIVGMDLHFGGCASLEDFYLSLYQGQQFFKDLPANRWKGMEELETLKKGLGLEDIKRLKGAWLEEFDLDILRFKIQPKEAERLTLQQTLMLTVADRALHDAGLKELQGKGANIAVLTAMESELEIHHRMGRWDLIWQVEKALEMAGLDMDVKKKDSLSDVLKNSVFQAFEDHSPSEHTGFIGNIISSRVSALWDFTGPSFTISSNENAVYKALDVARNMLALGEVDAVVVGAIDLSGSMEGVLSRHVLNPVNTGDISFGWNTETNGWNIGEGAGAIVIKRAEDAKNDRVYAQIDDVAIVQSDLSSLNGEINAQAVAKGAEELLQSNGLDASDIGLLEVSASGIASEDKAEIEGLTSVYQSKEENLTCALGSAKATVGHTFSASGIASIIRSALALYHRFIPASPQWSGPKFEEKFKNTPFYVPQVSSPWVIEEGKDTLRAAISGLATDGSSAHVLMSEGTHPQLDERSPYLAKGGERLFPLSIERPAGINEQLLGILTDVETLGFNETSDKLCEAFNPNAPIKPIFVAKSEKELMRDVAFFQAHMKDAYKGKKALQMPTGSYYNPNPISKDAKVAMMYPGSGAAYQGFGASLLQMFPSLYDHIKNSVNHPSRAFFTEYLYPRTLKKPTAEEIKLQEESLGTNALPVMAIGVAFATAYTVLLQDILKVKADSLAGYSMGETSSLWYGQGLWDGHQVDEKFLETNVFSEIVGGAMTILGEEWSMDAAIAKEKWRSRLITLNAETLGYATLEDWFRVEVEGKYERVYLTFINTDSEIIISGDNDILEKIMQKHALTSVTLTINNCAHHPFIRRVTEEFIAMHHLPLQKKLSKTVYSGVTQKPLVINEEVIANNGKEVCCQEVNLPKLIRSMHADGHELFIEVGANATLSRWIGEILKDKEHATIATDRKGSDSLKSFMGMIAQLLGQGVELDLQAIITKTSTKGIQRKKIYKTLHTGGNRFEEFAFTAENKAAFINSTNRVNTAEPVLAGEEFDMFALSEEKEEQTTTKDMDKNSTLDVIENKVKQKIAENGLALYDFDAPDYKASKKDAIWNEQDLLTFATGKISDVFGPEYSIIDTYPCRVMLPMPPYLLVSRVTKLNAKTNEYKPSSLTTEYDIPYNSWFATDGQIPWAVAVESGQCDLLLISYLGIDFQNKGEYKYRLLDCTLTFLDDLPFEGQTLRYDISIDSYVRNGNNLLFFFRYDCYVEDRMVLKMRGGCAGFFNEADLAEGQGVVFKPSEIEERNNRKQQFFEPLLHCDKTTFNQEELLALTQGDLAGVFGSDYNTLGRNKSLRLPPKDILMLDRITELDLKGGSSGIGWIEAEKDLKADDWYFPCHFRDDEVLAGSLQAEGGGQLLRFLMLYMGMQRLTKDARFQPVLDIPQKVRCRKEVNAKDGKLIYRMDVKEVGLVPEPYVVADLEIIYDDLSSVYFENLGLRLQEKDNPQYKKDLANTNHGVYVKPVNKPVLLDEGDITQFALGPVYKCFGDEYKVFEGRSLSRQPNTDLQVISRVLSISNERHDFSNNPTIISEYDVPVDAWYFKQNASPVMPYSVLMEVALQPCGFLGAYLGSTLSVPDKDLFFRNLDGDGEMLVDVDLQGKTITNKVVMTSHTNLAGTVLQRYTFELSVDGTVFYVGSSSFGFFTVADLSSQAGLDSGEKVPAWKDVTDYDQSKAITFNLDSLFGKMKLYKSTNPASPRLHLAEDQLNLLDSATIIKEGGKYGKGYIHATRAIHNYDWFFTCHFYQDPVMPGSLGVEAIHQAVQVWALQQGLGDGLANVGFNHHAPNKTVWKYRGQILQGDPTMNLDCHIKEVTKENGKVVILVDANLWKGDLRIYELTDLSLVIG